MFKLALKNLAAGKIRLLLTTLLIVIGVGFVSSSFILRDGLKDVFGDLAEETLAGVDVGISPLDSNNPITVADLDAVRAVPGVRAAELDLTSENDIQPIKPDGSTITLQGPPQLVFGWGLDGGLSPTTIVSGEAPLGPDQWVIDEPSKAEHGFVIGESYDMITPSGRKNATLVGTFTFDGFVEGPTFMAMELETLATYLVRDDQYDSISIAADGSVPIDEIMSQIDAELNSGVPRVEINNQEELVDDAQAGFNEALNIIGGILLGFALLSLFVSTFIIIVIFAITVGQRTRELGLLRAIGSTPGQVLRSVMAESFVIGLLSSVLGLGAGVLIALGLRAGLNAAGFGIPPFGIAIRPLTIFLAFLLGCGITMLAAAWPAFMASRISPIAAITGATAAKEKSVVRYIIGAVVAVIGVALMSLGLFGGADTVTGVLVPLGLGAAITFVGIALLSPLIAGPLSKVLGTPLAAVYGTPGRLAKDNAARNPRRTGTIASTLMVGLTVVSMTFVLGSSFTAEFDRILNTSIQGDYLVTSDQADIPDEVIERIANNDAFGNVTPVKYWSVGLANEPLEADTGVIPDDATGPAVDGVGYSADMAAFDYSQLDGLFNLSVVEGDITAMTNETTALRTNITEDLGLGLGDTITIFLADGSTADLEIIAIFEEAQIASGVLLTFDRFNEVSSQRTSDWVAADIAEGTTIEEADAEFAALANEYPNLAFQSSAEFLQAFKDQINFFIRIITLLLGLTIAVSLVGILATVSLSVFERVREIGLLRAVGTTRRQIRTMVRWEGAIICAVGAILGAVLGIGLAVLILNAIPGDFISTVAIPWISIVVMVLIASVLGLLSALLPAWWASRLNVLDAISHS